MKNSVSSFAQLEELFQDKEAEKEQKRVQELIEKLCFIGNGFQRLSKATGRTSDENMLRKSTPKNKMKTSKRVRIITFAGTGIDSLKPSKTEKVCGNNPLLTANKLIQVDRPKEINLLGHISRQELSNQNDKNWDKKSYNM